MLKTSKENNHFNLKLQITTSFARFNLILNKACGYRLMYMH